MNTEYLKEKGYYNPLKGFDKTTQPLTEFANQSKWIDVKDELPKKYKMVIINFNGTMSRVKGNVCEGWWNGKYWDCYAILTGLNEKITVIKWQNLPTAP